MNSSNKFKFVWWATAGCASRATSQFFTSMGVDDLYNHAEGFVHGQGGSFTHKHGFPEGKEDWSVVCNLRNPYSLIVSGYLDIKVDKSNLEFSDYVKNDYFSESSLERTDPFFLNAWKNFHKGADYLIRMESMEEDLRKLPFFDVDEERWTNSLYSVRENFYMNESPYDVYEGKFQKYKKYYTQEIADVVYYHMKPYFDLGGYDRDSWK